MACGGLAGLTDAKCEALRGRDVILYPDAGCHDQWKRRAAELKGIANFTVSDTLERKVPAGLDLADVIKVSPPPPALPPPPVIPPQEYRRIADAIFPFIGNDVLNEIELIYAMIWYNRRKLPAIDRAKVSTPQDKETAWAMATELIAAGAIIGTPPPVVLYHHYASDPFGYKETA